MYDLTNAISIATIFNPNLKRGRYWLLRENSCIHATEVTYTNPLIQLVRNVIGYNEM
jgi:hypothetical protein